MEQRLIQTNRSIQVISMTTSVKDKGELNVLNTNSLDVFKMTRLWVREF